MSYQSQCNCWSCKIVHFYDIGQSMSLAQTRPWVYKLRNIQRVPLNMHTGLFRCDYVYVLDLIYFDGILPKGPYPPCLRMADRALLAGYPLFTHISQGCVTSIEATRLLHGPLTRYVKLQVAHAPGMPGTFSPAADFKENRLLAIPACMSGLLTCGDRENVPGIPGACAPAILRICQEAHCKWGSPERYEDNGRYPTTTVC